MEIKFMHNGIKINGKLYCCFYQKGGYTEQSKLPREAITIYSKSYERIPKNMGLNVINETDLQTDYFEKDRILILPDCEHYNAALQAYNKYNQRKEKKQAKTTDNGTFKPVYKCDKFQQR